MITWPTAALAALLVPGLHAAIALAGFPRVHRSLRVAPRAGRPAAATRIADHWTLALSRVRAYSPLPGNCLSRSLVLWWMLRRRGVPVTLHLGVSRRDAQLAAHAWVEQEGVVLNDTQDVRSRYAPLHSYSSSSVDVESLPAARLSR